MTDRLPSEESIFLQALEIPEDADRRAFLDQICGDDTELAAGVNRLLRAHGKAGDLLDLPDSFETTDEIAAQSGTVVGPYRLLEQIGEGGMGVVFMAAQIEPIQRTVALKIIKPGMDNRQVTARFEAERQALAMMDHPNIATVLDAGMTDNGQPYFVMELVKGMPITNYCDKHLLPLPARLELFAQVCQAVQHAHQKGIIHRDLKPSNVLVAEYDNRAVPKVIDFGVAKATAHRSIERTMFTEFGQVLGTMEYMSPEQASCNQLDIDTRSDIYSLGVLLYELLTGSTPFERNRMRGAAFDEVLRIIREEEPPTPSRRLSSLSLDENAGLPSLGSIAARRQTEPIRLRRDVRGELDWIVMKALEKDRNRRYETANGFAADIERHLHNQPVEAGPPSASYRFRKFAHRNRIAFTMAGVVAAALILGIAGTTWQAILATTERDRALKAEQQASANFQNARKIVDEYFIAVSETTLLDKPGLEPLRKELLERALQYYRGLLAQRSDDRRLQTELAATYLRMSVVNIMFDAGDEAFSALQAALEIINKLGQQHSNDDQLERTLAGYWHVERHFYNSRTSGPHTSQPLKGLGILKQATQMWEKFVRGHPDVSAFQNDLAAFSTYSGDLSHDLGQGTEALHAYERAAELREALVRDNPKSREYRAALGESRTGLAWMQQRYGRPEDAEHTYRQAVALQEQLVQEAPDVPNYRVGLANACRHFGTALLMTNQLSEAERATRRALEIMQALAVEFADVPAYQIELAVNWRELGSVLAAAAKPKEADEAYQRSIDLGEHLAGKFPNQPNYGEELGWTYLHAADWWATSGQIGKADSAYGQALSHIENYSAAFPYLVEYRRAIADIRSKHAELLKSNNSALK